MKPKELLYLLGLKPKPRSYGHDVISFDIPPYGAVDYARWRHPREATRTIGWKEVAEIRKFISPGDVAIDIGAHTGDSTIPIALAAGPSGRVLAIEPNPYVFPVLSRNAELNPDKTNILPLMFAATAEDGEIEFEYSDAGFCNGGRHHGISRWRHAHAFSLTVQGRNLECYLRNEQPDLVARIRYVKVDAEGYDLQILRSIASLLAQVRPYIKAEVFCRTSRSVREEMVDFLSRLGYSLFRVAGDDDYRGEPVTAADVMQWRQFDLFCIPNEPAPGTVRAQAP